MPPQIPGNIADLFVKLDMKIVHAFNEVNVVDLAMVNSPAAYQTYPRGGTPTVSDGFVAEVFILGGRSATREDGKATLEISHYLNMTWDSDGHVGIATARPWLVATPHDSSPVILTTDFALTPGIYGRPGELTVESTVMSWQTDGKPAPWISFDWHCIVKGYRTNIIL